MREDGDGRACNRPAILTGLGLIGFIKGYEFRKVTGFGFTEGWARTRVLGVWTLGFGIPVVRLGLSLWLSGEGHPVDLI